MPGVFGIIDFREEKGFIDKINNSIVEKSYEIYDIDQFKHIKTDMVYMSYASQFMTEEYSVERLPFLSEDFTFVCDGMIHNRDELSKKLDISNHQLDSIFILESYKKWGYDLLDDVVGEFAFCIFDNNKGNVFLCRDHVGKQAIYYYFKDGILIFSSLIKTIVNVLKNINININRNERYLANVVAIDGMLNEYEVGDTPYEDIFIVPPATYLVFDSMGYESVNYWNPLNIKPLRLKSDEEYNRKFLEVFKESVRCRLRSINNTAIKISGGLDSTSVAALVCMELKKDGRNLYGYNFSPLEEFNEPFDEYYIPNEFEYVNVLSEAYPNLICECVTFNGENSLRDARELVDVLEMPYKIVENLYWGTSILKKARENNSRVILSGQFGNSTISFGDFNAISNELLKKNPLLFYKELKAYCIRGRYYKKRILKRFLKAKFKIGSVKDTPFKFSIINSKLIEKYKLEGVYSKLGINSHSNNTISLDEINKKVFSPCTFNHLGIIESKIALYTGVMTSDPTKDKRVIEFCLSLPPEQYIRNGEDRYLIRRAMKGILPDFIRENYRIKGIQSFDWVYRLHLDKDFVNQEINKMMENKKCKEYIDFTKVFIDGNQEINDYKERIGIEEMRRVIKSLIFNYYIMNDD